MCGVDGRLRVRLLSRVLYYGLSLSRLDWCWVPRFNLESQTGRVATLSKIPFKNGRDSKSTEEKLHPKFDTGGDTNRVVNNPSPKLSVVLGHWEPPYDGKGAPGNLHPLLGPLEGPQGKLVTSR